MIQQIKVKNFQSHCETSLDLHEGVNALVGLTGAGKSVVFKALDWLFCNRPLGDEYRSWWGGDTQVEIVLKEGGQRVGRVRTDSTNYYYIDKQKFEAFGKGSPPQPVVDLLNLSDVNFQGQVDPSFLISSSSGEVARYLNKAAHLDIIDQTLSNIASVLRKEKEDLGQARQDLTRNQEQLSLYDWLPEADEKLTQLEKLQERILTLKIESSAIIEISKNYDLTAGELVGLKGILGCGVEVEKLILLNQEIEKQNVRWEQLAAIVDQYEKAEKELEGLIPLESMKSEVKGLLVLGEEVENKRQKYRAFFDLVSDCDKNKKEIAFYDWLPGVTKEFERLENLNFNAKKLLTDKIGLETLIKSVSEASELLTQTEKDCEKLQKEFIRAMPNTCPLCEQEIKK